MTLSDFQERIRSLGATTPEDFRSRVSEREFHAWLKLRLGRLSRSPMPPDI